MKTTYPREKDRIVGGDIADKYARKYAEMVCSRHVADELAIARQEGRQEGIEAAIKVAKSFRPTGATSKTPIINALCSLRDGLIREET